MLRSLFFYFVLFINTLSFSVLAVVAALVTRGGNAPHLVGRFWARTILMASGVRVQLQGMDNVDHRQAYVFAANHQSHT